MTNQELIEYFKAEKSESIFFIFIGILSIFLSLFLFYKTKFYIGIAYPLIAIGLIQITVGSTIYFRTDGQIETLLAQKLDDPEKFAIEEIERMEKVNHSFDIYKIVEISLAFFGILLVIMFWKITNIVWFGVGIGLFVQSIIMLLADLVAEKRADNYTYLLKTFLKNL
jgi:hypothetical protein